jgi:hypothetical protein
MVWIVPNFRCRQLRLHIINLRLLVVNMKTLKGSRDLAVQLVKAF